MAEAGVAPGAVIDDAEGENLGADQEIPQQQAQGEVVVDITATSYYLSLAPDREECIHECRSRLLHCTISNYQNGAVSKDSTRFVGIKCWKLVGLPSILVRKGTTSTSISSYLGHIIF